MERIETQRKKGGRAATQAWENLGDWIQAEAAQAGDMFEVGLWSRRRPFPD